MEAKDFCQDGSVDLRGHPVLAFKTGKWKACAFLVGYEAFERMAFYAIASNLVVYLTTELHEDTVSSVKNVNNWSGTVWMTPILGAYVADSYLGRFWTFTLSSLIYVMGMILLTMAVSIKYLKPTCANGVCNKASPSQIAFFYSALYVIAVGAGGTKPNISTFGADQFDDYNPHEKTLKASFFNWWMFSSFIGALMATLCLVYIQENLGWGFGYGIPTVGLLLSLFIFYVGTPSYRHKVRKARSPAGDLLKVAIAAFANRKLSVPSHPSELYECERQHYIDSRKCQVHHTPIFKFLDKAAIKEGSPSCASKTPCTVTQVEGAKLVLGMLMIWLVTLIPSTIWAQINTLFVKQGTTLDSRVGSTFQIPAASLTSFVTLSMLLCVPIYDRYFVPFMRKKTGNPRGITLLQRQGIGFVIQIIAIANAYAVEVKRMNVLRVNQAGRKDIVPMSIFWLLPQYVLLGIADVFSCIGLLEFFYDQSPKDMQSLGTTFFTSGIGVGNFLNSFLVTVVDEITGRGGRKSWIGRNLNDSHLDYYYGFLMVLSALNLGAFLWASSVYVYKGESTEVKAAVYVQMEGKTIDVSPLGLQV